MLTPYEVLLRCLTKDDDGDDAYELRRYEVEAKCPKSARGVALRKFGTHWEVVSVLPEGTVSYIALLAAPTFTTETP